MRRVLGGTELEEGGTGRVDAGIQHAGAANSGLASVPWSEMWIDPRPEFSTWMDQSECYSQRANSTATALIPSVVASAKQFLGKALLGAGSDEDLRAVRADSTERAMPLKLVGLQNCSPVFKGEEEHLGKVSSENHQQHFDTFYPSISIQAFSKRLTQEKVMGLRNL
ncbi:hypothetical protein GN956_G18767 [Arapaima gigas]